MGFNCGIAGLPNVGKSTIFNALTKGKAQAENYPFCTIDPNVGIVPVPDPRLGKIQEICPASKATLTTVEIVDIAGLVKGASQGEGLGNQFLSHIGGVDAILEVVRVFEDENVTHVMGGIDPARDVEIVRTELILKDLEILGRHAEKTEKIARSGEKAARRQMEWIKAFTDRLNQGKTLRGMELSAEEKGFIKELNLLTNKPVLYLANVPEGQIGAPDSDAVKALREIAAAEGSSAVLISGKIEEELSQLDPGEQDEYLKSMGLEEPGLNRVVREGYKLLGLITFFTMVGTKENRAWTVRQGARAPEAAGRVHTDFEKGFIRAEVMGFDDFAACGSEAAARQTGKLRTEGKEYIVQDGDIIRFRFNV